jgi:hypothetical protein
MSHQFKIRGVVAIGLVAALVAVTAPSAMAEAPDVAKSIAVAKTGSSGRDVVGREVKGHGVTVSPAKSKDGKNLRTLVQEPTDGVAALAVLEDGQSSAVFNGMLPAGSTVTPTAGGDHQVLTPDGTRLTVKAPWARDAAGKSLPTSYTFAPGQITQNVDTAGATFPVVADPSVSFGWRVYVRYSAAEVRDQVTGWRGTLNDKAKYTALLCLAIPNVIASWACAAFVYDASASIVGTAQTAAAQGRGMEIQYSSYPTPGIPLTWFVSP